MKRPVLENPQLDGNSFHFEGNNGIGVVIFHGFTSTTVEVRNLAEFFHSAGYSVSAPLLAGHGTCPEDAVRVKLADWLDSAEQSYQTLVSNCDQIAVGGESMGGLLALHMANTHPEIRGILVYAPAIHIDGQWRTPFLAPFIKITPKYYLSDDPEPPKPDTLPWQGYNVIPIPAAAQFYYLQKRILRVLPAIQQPLLAFQGRLDGTINPAGAKTLLKRIGSKDKTLTWLEKSGHTLLLGPEHKLVFEKSLDFLKRVTN